MRRISCIRVLGSLVIAAFSIGNLEASSYGGYYNSSPMRGGYGDFYPYQRAVTAEGDYLRALGNLRLQTAQAALVLAQAQGDYARAQAYIQFIYTLNRDSYRLEARLKKSYRLYYKVEKQAGKLDNLLRAKTDSLTVTAVEFFLAMLPPLALQEIMQTDIEPLPASDFTLRYKQKTVKDPTTGLPSREDIVLEDFPGGNLFTLIAFLRANPVNAVAGSAAHEALVNLRNQIANAGANILSNIEAKISGLSDEKAHLWEPALFANGELPGRQPPL